ncbi:MAG: FAD-dependent oxidoreductase [Paracholeplasma sp.]|nr:FAD-dependent oxidoreductase [Paracholeplasma sp.]MDY3196480.1 FAD-dependent oxidoreductase [Paracholeplasma sp.]
MIYDVCVIGGGAAGIASAKNSYEEGLKIRLIERNNELGGILNQCIHSGFGIHHYKEELTGPEYAERIQNELTIDIEVSLNTSVVRLIKDNNLFHLTLSSEQEGIQMIKSRSVIISTGSYERTRSQIYLPGKRLKGIFSAGSAQRYMNQLGYMVGKKVVILGSGDIGLIMARRMTLEGAKVEAVVELMAHSNGLTRNLVSCLEDFDIPLYLSHTISDIYGDKSLKAVEVSKVDEHLRPIEADRFLIECDTLLLSVGLIPEISLLDEIKPKKDTKTRSVIVNQTYQTSIDGLFVCGNSLQIHDLVDFVSKEAEIAGRSARNYVLNKKNNSREEQDVLFDEHLSYVVPQQIDFSILKDDFEVSFRVKEKYEEINVFVYQDDKQIKNKRIKFALPSEMEKITIAKDSLSSKASIKIMVEVIK